MPVAVTLPELGDSVGEAIISRWLRFPGDHVTEGEALLEVSTDKVDTEISAPASGRLTDVRTQEGQTLPVGATLAYIEEQPSGSGEGTADVPGPASESDNAAHASHSDGGDRPYVTPLVRRLAIEHGIDLATIEGSGIGKRIRKTDVLAAARASTGASPSDTPNPYLSALVSLRVSERGVDASQLRGTGHRGRIRLADVPAHSAPVAGTAQPDRTEKLTRLRSVIATRMVDSLRNSAQLTTVVEVDVTALSGLRTQHGAAFHATHGTKLSFTHFFVRALTDTLTDFPSLNASIADDGVTVTYHSAIDLNLAVDTDRGLVAPVIRNAHTLDIAQTATAIATLADRARTGRLTADDLTSGTFTVTNTGSRGALFDTPIINPPQVAILGVGAVVARATVARDERGAQTIDIRDMAYLSLTYDHRLIDGADAARFLTAIKSRIERAEFSEEIVRALR